jgi:hypothetical protein
MATKSQRHAKAWKKSLSTDLSVGFRNAHTPKQTLNRGSVYNGGRAAYVIERDGSLKIDKATGKPVLAAINASGAVMPKYGRASSPSKFDTRSENLGFSKKIKDAVEVAAAVRQNPSKVESVANALDNVKKVKSIAYNR